MFILNGYILNFILLFVLFKLYSKNWTILYKGWLSNYVTRLFLKFANEDILTNTFSLFVQKS